MRDGRRHAQVLRVFPCSTSRICYVRAEPLHRSAVTEILQPLNDCCTRPAGREEDTGIDPHYGDTFMNRQHLQASRRNILRWAAGASVVGSTGLWLGAAAAQPAQTTRIGMVRPLTGRFASSFAPLFAPARVAAEEINAAGGLLGRKIEFVDEDDDGSPAKEPAVMRKLREAGINIVIGPVGTSQAVSALQVSTAEKMLHATGAFAVDVVDGNKYPYHYQFNYNTKQQSFAILEFLKGMKQDKIGILHEVSGWGESLAAQVVERMKAAGLTPVGVESFALNAVDVRNQVRNLQRAGATAIVAGCSIVPAALLVLNALKGVAWYPVVAGGNGFQSDSLLDILPAEGTDRIHATYLKTFSYTATKPPGEREMAYAKKLAAYPEVKGQEPNAVVSPFYDFLHVLKMVSDSTKSLEPTALKRGFDTLKNYRGISGTLSITPENHCAIPDEAVTLVKIASARDARSMGFFRERAFD
jgi:ABC-type branched-subunit amino acid transport system substrate-binding protein